MKKSQLVFLIVCLAGLLPQSAQADPPYNLACFLFDSDEKKEQFSSLWGSEDKNQRFEALLNITNDKILSGISYSALFTYDFHKTESNQRDLFCTTITNNLGYYYEFKWDEYINIIESISKKSKTSIYFSDCDHYGDCSYYISSPINSIQKHNNTDDFPDNIKNSFKVLDQP
ncbi:MULTISPECIES: hypothetical protein [Pseudoalteromonas]|uniref:hypothetical protein n=1 Tax=Pseudoalteromonas TaxID=53246 RepID=UPI000467BB25|nr:MULTISPECIES: hypothetical protein [Pseudoalteromonas]|tara:strand:- start:11393 stop:11908 length:516 start_codon:yes stop_codon:yes gene_type:complete